VQHEEVACLLADTVEIYFLTVHFYAPSSFFVLFVFFVVVGGRHRDIVISFRWWNEPIPSR
jgi:hypothetical protein